MRRLKRTECAVLHLGLKRPWYARINSGEKRIEFREAKEYWETRIRNWMSRMNDGKTHVLEFQNGYGRFSPRMWFIAGNGAPPYYDFRSAEYPVEHRELGEFPKDRYCLFIGERIILED